MRKLATIRRIEALLPIEGADKIECAIVDGWSVVVQKGLYRPKTLAVYFEIDSWIPHYVAPFLTKPDHFPKEFQEIKGERLKTVKLRGQLSQGLLMPISELMVIESENLIDYTFTNKLNGKVTFIKIGDEDTLEGVDLTDFLGILKWERPLPTQLAGMAKGNFPTEVPKTDQERCQNLKKEIKIWADLKVNFEQTEKLDGSSCTFYLDEDGVFHVCSRNIDLKDDGINSFWLAAKKYDIENKMVEHALFGIALQGELVGEGIQDNKYKIKGQDFYLYDMYHVKKREYFTPANRQYIAAMLKIPHVPVLKVMQLTGDIDDLLMEAQGKSLLNEKQEREGHVYKSTDGKFSFKAISNKFLLKGGD